MIRRKEKVRQAASGHFANSRRRLRLAEPRSLCCGQGGGARTVPLAGGGIGAARNPLQRGDPWLDRDGAVAGRQEFAWP